MRDRPCDPRPQQLPHMRMILLAAFAFIAALVKSLPNRHHPVMVASEHLQPSFVFAKVSTILVTLTYGDVAVRWSEVRMYAGPRSNRCGDRTERPYPISIIVFASSST